MSNSNQEGDEFEKVLEFISVPVEEWLEIKSISPVKKDYFPISEETESKVEFSDFLEILKVVGWKKQGKQEKISLMQHFFFKYIFKNTNENRGTDFFIFEKDSYKSLAFLHPYTIDYYYARCNFGFISHEKYKPPVISYNEDNQSIEIFYWGVYVHNDYYLVGKCHVDISNNLEMNIKITKNWIIKRAKSFFRSRSRSPSLSKKQDEYTMKLRSSDESQSENHIPKKNIKKRGSIFFDNTDMIFDQSE
eukprot:gene1191-10705_t